MGPDLLVSVAVVSRAKWLQFTPAPALIDAFIDDRTDDMIIDHVVRCGMVWVVRRWLQRGRRAVQPHDLTMALDTALVNADIGMVEALFTYRPKDSVFAADEGGANVANVMAWLKGNGRDDYVDGFFPNLLYNGTLEIAQWVYAHWRGANHAIDIDRLVERAHSMKTLHVLLEILQWVHTLPSPCCTLRASTRAMDSAALSNDLKVVEWLHVNRTEGCTVEAMHWAACFGYIDVVKFLHSNRSEGCSQATMDGAALNGHLEVIQFLHANRTEGCTKKAMDAAASRGHLAVVQFLHENRSEGCTTKAMDSAAWNGHLGVVRYLHENRTEGCTRRGMAAALRRRQIRVVEYMSKARIGGLRGQCRLHRR